MDPACHMSDNPMAWESDRGICHMCVFKIYAHKNFIILQVISMWLLSWNDEIEWFSKKSCAFILTK